MYFILVPRAGKQRERNSVSCKMLLSNVHEFFVRYAEHTSRLRDLSDHLYHYYIRQVNVIIIIIIIIFTDKLQLQLAHTSHT